MAFRPICTWECSSSVQHGHKIYHVKLFCAIFCDCEVTDCVVILVHYQTCNNLALFQFQCNLSIPSAFQVVHPQVSVNTYTGNCKISDRRLRYRLYYSFFYWAGIHTLDKKKTIKVITLKLFCISLMSDHAFWQFLADRKRTGGKNDSCH